MGWTKQVLPTGSLDDVGSLPFRIPLAELTRLQEKAASGLWFDDEGFFVCCDADFDYWMNDDFMAKYTLDENGEPKKEYSLMKWGKWFSRSDAVRHIANHYLPLGIHVSTIFLGLDHGFSIEHEHLPVLWETMIFGGKEDMFQDRYTSKEDAIQGHLAALRLLVETGRCSTRTKKTLRKRVLPILKSYGQGAKR